MRYSRLWLGFGAQNEVRVELFVPKGMGFPSGVSFSYPVEISASTKLISHETHFAARGISFQRQRLREGLFDLVPTIHATTSTFILHDAACLPGKGNSGKLSVSPPRTGANRKIIRLAPPPPPLVTYSTYVFRYAISCGEALWRNPRH